MKFTQILILAILLISCKNKSPNEFNLDVKLNGNYSGYLYLNYDKIKDSCLIKDGKAFFRGTVSNPTSANYATNYISVSDKNFYIENEKIESEITISKKQNRDSNIDWITIDKISGTKTSIIRKDFEDFRLKFSSDENWQNLLFDKLQEIIEQNPQHIYSGDLLSEISNDTLLTNNQIGILYHKLDIEFQGPFSIKQIELKAFPENIIKLNDSIYDFDLPNTKNKLISTLNFRGQILFIDFWASWCKPCREQFPELTKINNTFKQKGFTILGVSLDKKKGNWQKAIEKENPNWVNVIDTSAVNGKLAKKYGIFGIPYNILVDRKGKVIANNITLEQLRVVLDSLITNKKTIANNG
jgi:peroxiredoxin